MLTLGTTLRCWEALVAVLGAVGGFEASWRRGGWRHRPHCMHLAARPPRLLPPRCGC
ncbi:hypothetical protein CHLRE_16g674151v5 [Chlamydomonas reinhardtii]|uniref:Uncharacterized protein n=1 Tax=Chlamydomonas reinhardtii TaxID=3055 RepID=A0A2K3CVI8_CHLRE|nr:uncharacterized protein CHLRE_16g674151v5 [Chlamydomonas reinhardtii]PNW72294.1 hypothetical protein CHLRE_16g674151v5 [Chlamydomonas reinhardtii]